MLHLVHTRDKGVNDVGGGNMAKNQSRLIFIREHITDVPTQAVQP